MASILLITACGPVKTTSTNEYTLDAYSTKKITRSPTNINLLVSLPEAVSGLQTEQMQYTKNPHELNSFSKNSWASPPASMLYPLIIQSLQQSGYFHAILSGAYADEGDYRLDTQLLELQQNFLKRPSTITLAAKITLTDAKSNKVVASKTFREKLSCPFESPYGGVIAANRASANLTAFITKFAVANINRNH